MALLGSFIDIQTTTLSLPVARSLTHSLGTVPDFVFLQLRSQFINSVSPIVCDIADQNAIVVKQLGTSIAMLNTIAFYFWTPMR